MLTYADRRYKLHIFGVRAERHWLIILSNCFSHVLSQIVLWVGHDGTVKWIEQVVASSHLIPLRHPFLYSCERLVPSNFGMAQGILESIKEYNKKKNLKPSIKVGIKHFQLF